MASATASSFKTLDLGLETFLESTTAAKADKEKYVAAVSEFEAATARGDDSAAASAEASAKSLRSSAKSHAASAKKASKALTTVLSGDFDVETYERKLKAGEAKKLQALIGKASQVDLCFCLDATGSMGHIINCVKDEIRNIIRDMQKAMRQFKVKLALVVYRDPEDGADHFEIFDFNSSISAFETKLASVRAHGGGDQCEDVIGGLKKTSELSWSLSNKVMIMCGDAPCHGARYYTSAGDNHKSGLPGVERAEPFLKDLIQKGVQTVFLKLNSSTDKMIQVFNEEVGREYIDQVAIEGLDGASLSAAVTKTVKASLTASVTGSVTAARSAFGSKSSSFSAKIKAVRGFASTTAAGSSLGTIGEGGKRVVKSAWEDDTSTSTAREEPTEATKRETLRARDGGGDAWGSSRDGGGSSSAGGASRSAKKTPPRSSRSSDEQGRWSSPPSSSGGGGVFDQDEFERILNKIKRDEEVTHDEIARFKMLKSCRPAAFRLNPSEKSELLAGCL